MRWRDLTWRNPILLASIALIVASGGYLLHQAVKRPPDPVAQALGARECDRTRNPFRTGTLVAGRYYSCQMPSGKWRCVIVKGHTVHDITDSVRFLFGKVDRQLGLHDFACLDS